MLNESKTPKEYLAENKQLSIKNALIPVFLLIFMLAINIIKEEILGRYTNHYILITASIFAAIVGFYNKINIYTMMVEIWKNIKSVFIAILILLLVGALAGTWLVSGIIPAMVYYGLKVLDPNTFLPVSIILCAIVSIATGSSWTTSATLGIALVGIGTTGLGIPSGMIAGAVISGTYFGDKMSPLSDTTNLASATAGTDLFTHIRYMLFTTVPTILVTILVFTVLNLSIETTGNTDVKNLLNTIENTFNITPYLFAVPGIVIVLILFKTKPLTALSIGILFAITFALIFQADVLTSITSSKFNSIVQAIFVDTSITTTNEDLNKLFASGGMLGMLWTILLIISAMIFGGIMEAIGALSTITKKLLKLAKSVFSLFASTVISCFGLNVIASDQYLSVLIPGKMLKKAYKDRNLAPENLSRTLEDSGTVTSVLVPWNTCAAYQSSVLGVSVGDYFVYAIFNWLSPFTTLIYAALRIKIRTLKQGMVKQSSSE